jgi:serine/threonine protein kinase
MMPQERDIVAEALQKADPRERTAFLDQACAGDSALRARVDELLWRKQEAVSSLDCGDLPLVPSVRDLPVGQRLERLLQPQAMPPSPTPDEKVVTIDSPPLEGPGTLIGPYKLLEQIGEGGFGLVFMAEQQQPIRRKVAVKVLKPGMDTRQVIARFDAERQALALMDHPNIARVLDAGQTSSVRPFFVMELVRGVPITEYCDQYNLTPRERLELFITLCHAVQHAHQKGIIHRDLKPSNVMVTMLDGEPVAKVIDFGIAKALGPQLTERTLYTGFAQLIGTPMYMSPEQAALSAQDVDTRSDIYSLGVILYELLTGTTPLDRKRLGRAAYDEMCRIIREEEPPKPSTRISTLGEAATSVSARRGSDPRRLGQLCRGELDWIVMKALEKNRNRRYDTAGAFAVDIERYLRDEAVEACPPSSLYRLRKFARRYRGPLATAGLLVLLLVSGMVVSLWQWRVSEARRLQAEKAEVETRKVAAQLKAVNDFLIDDLLGQASPFKNPVGANTTIRELLDKAAKEIDDNKAVAAEPEVEATIRDEIGHVYSALGLSDKAESHMERALEIRQRVLGGQHPKTLSTKTSLAWVFFAHGRCAEAEKIGREALAELRETLGDEDPETLRAAALGWVLTKTGRAKEAEPLLREGLDICRKRLPRNDWFTAHNESLLGGCLLEQRQYPQAEPFLLSGYKGLLMAAGMPPVTDHWPIRPDEGLHESPGAPPERIRQALERIISLYEAWGKPDQATVWRAKKLTSLR